LLQPGPRQDKGKVGKVIDTDKSCGKRLDATFNFTNGNQLLRFQSTQKGGVGQRDRGALVEGCNAIKGSDQGYDTTLKDRRLQLQG
jgi:hypothetical protein